MNPKWDGCLRRAKKIAERAFVSEVHSHSREGLKHGSSEKGGVPNDTLL